MPVDDRYDGNELPFLVAGKAYGLGAHG
jgi:hypothetical protein